MLSENNIALTKDRIRQFHKMKLAMPALPVPVTTKAVDAIASQLSGMPKLPSQFDLEHAHQRLADALRDNALHSIRNSDWKLAAYVLWYGNEKLAAKPIFLKSYLEWLQSNSLPSNWRRLIYSYLRDFGYSQSHAESYKILSKMIRYALSQPELKNRLQNWKDRHEKYGLFDENLGVGKAVKAFMQDANNDWRSYATITGLEGGLEFGGYSELIGLELLKRIPGAPTLSMFKAVQSFHVHDKQLRFNDKRATIIESVLAPWIDNKEKPSEDARKLVQEWLLIQFNDPRLPVHRDKGWRFVNEQTLQIMYRWLVGESLDQFFAIIDQMALEHQWKYRKAFWKAYHESGLLDEAWVALGPDAKYYARNIFGDTLSAGELDGVTHGSQSVLILRIRDLVLAEWSHNGKCRAWKIGDSFCPETYKMKYNGFSLKSQSMKIVDTHQQDGISHQGSENYRWQQRLADFIYDQTGIRIQQRDFRI